FVDVIGKPARHLVQGVGTRFTRYFDRPWAENEQRQSRLVVIGESGLNKKEIIAAIQMAATDKAA
ncbi:MAG: GTP-binding protein, partial [Rhodospirillaceae bacterium]|nr:GTP-binding protein [Rhodospirillaceae bacterium]